MEQKPVFLTEKALCRSLKAFAERLGVEETLADAMAQIHLQQVDTHSNWTTFLQRNCFQCVKAPTACEFLTPTQELCPPNTSARSVQNANMTVIEMGKLLQCPARVDLMETRIREVQGKLPPASETTTNDSTEP